ncbi:hypothetical protein CDL15_Pgr015189 [Punica granatum]|uniref:SHSP domain-containing protein n=1 Tax=Punica granatum TaxID=22663 RepID=A0A218VZ44_PUNGR|nr:hypothetical protein CDL15_Pgr015189 [Punica granatum]
MGAGGRRGGGPFSSDLWDPSGAWGQTLSDRDRGDETSALAHTHVDWLETDNAHVFRADIPALLTGVRKEEVKAHVEDNNVLQISGERSKEQQENTNDKWHRVERRRGSFSRRFRLPNNADLDGIKCSLENGVLTVTVPKKDAEPSQKADVRYIDVA